jgi:hypothetical protein
MYVIVLNQNDPQLIRNLKILKIKLTISWPIILLISPFVRDN